MLKPRSSKIVQEVDVELFQLPIFWVPFVFTSIVVFGGYSESLLSLTWVDALVRAAADTLPSLERFAAKSRFPDVTRLIFTMAWLFSLFYALLIARWTPYRDQFFLGPVVSKRPHLTGLVVALMIGGGVAFLTLIIPEESTCTRKCFYKSPAFQVFYTGAGSYLLGHGLAMLYWWLSNFTRIHFSKRLE